MMTMFVNWPDLSSNLGRAFPVANVNLLCDDEGSEDIIRAMEIRPNARSFWKNAMLPAKWNVTITDNCNILLVTIYKAEKQALEKMEFGYHQIHEIVEYLKSHPFIMSKWTYCKGISNSDRVPLFNRLIIDHFGGMCIWRSMKCKLLVPKDDSALEKCEHCASAHVSEETTSAMDMPELPEEVESPTYPEDTSTMAAPGKKEADEAPTSPAVDDKSLPLEEIDENIQSCDDQKITLSEDNVGGVKKHVSSTKGMKRKSKKSNHKWKCSVCHEELRTHALLRRHNSEAHSDHPRFQFTSFYLKTVSPLNAGVDINAKTTVFRCTSKSKPSRNCDRPFYSVGNWIRHMQVHSGEPDLHIPDLKEYKKLWQEFIKQRASDDWKTKYKQRMGKFICDICGAVMTYPSRFKHMETVHKMGEQLSCEVCGYVTNNRHTLRVHMRTHSDERPYACPHCGKTFKHRFLLSRCKRKCTGEGLFECSTCGRKFCDKQRMKEHELLHGSIRPFGCPICKVASYLRKENLKIHLKRIHQKDLADVGYVEFEMLTLAHMS